MCVAMVAAAAAAWPRLVVVKTHQLLLVLLASALLLLQLLLVTIATASRKYKQWSRTLDDRRREWLLHCVKAEKSWWHRCDADKTTAIFGIMYDVT